MVHQENVGRTRNRCLALLPVALLGVSACGGDFEPSSGESISENPEELWQVSGTTPWTGGIVRVCFDSTVPSSLRKRVREQIEATWETVALVDFYQFQSCPSQLPSGSLVRVRVDSSISPALGLTSHPGNPAGGVTQVAFASGSPPDKTIVHEFGHVLGFHEENEAIDPCVQRSGAGISLEGQTDMSRSVMSQSACNNYSTLSAWDILGVRRLYGLKPPGSIAGLGGLSLNIEGALTSFGQPIIGWPAAGAWNSTWLRPNSSSLLLEADAGSTQRCLNVEGGGVGPDLTPLVSWECDEDADNEKFSFTGVAWRAMGNRCITAESNQAGARLALAACSGGVLQRWDFFNATTRIRLNATNLCVQVPGGSTALGTELELANCSTSSNQRFGYTRGLITFSTRCFNVLGGTTANGSRIGLWNGCAASPPLHNAQFTIRGPVHALTQCVEMSGGVPFDGVPIGVAPCTGAARQTWEYYW